jgi:hypothetical protein
MQQRPQFLHPRLLAAVVRQPVQDLELAHAEPELAERLVQRTGRAGVLCQELTPLL